MAYRLCTSLPSWLEGFDPPYPLHFFMVGFPSGQRGQTVNLLARLSMVRIHLPPPFQKQCTSIGCFFFAMVEEITANAVNAVKQHGVETSGSTARSDVRERSEGNPSPTTILKFKTIANAMVFFCAKIQLARIIVLNLTKRRCSDILDRSI